MTTTTTRVLITDMFNVVSEKLVECPVSVDGRLHSWI